MSEMALDLITRAMAEKWKRLDLGKCGGVGAVPEAVGELEGLKELVLSEEWDGKIKKELKEADIILFLVSADFLSTDYVWDIKMKTAIERDARGEAKVVPIVVRPCVWKDTPLWKFYSPEKATPISMAENRDAAWERVVVDLERIMVAGAEGGGL